MARVAIATIALLCALPPLSAQQGAVSVPGRAGRVTPIPASIGTNVLAPLHDDFRLPDGRLQWLWRFEVQGFRVSAGRYDLTLRVAGGVPVQLTLYRIEGRTGRENLIERQDLGGPIGAAGGDRRVTLTHAGSYILSATSTQPEASRQGAVYIGIDAPAQPPEPMSPQTQTAIQAKPQISRDAVFRNLALSATQARFGEHVSLTPAMTDLPPGCNQWKWTSVEVQGLLPPGLRLTPKSLNIEGTPRRVGTWTFTYTVRGLSCDGSSTVYGDRSISVTFTVLP